MTAIGNEGMLAASIVAKATLTMALALMAVRVARRSRAAVRHALLAAAFAVLPMMPVASLIAPSVPIPVPAGIATPTFVPAFDEVQPTEPAATSSAAPAAKPHPFRPSL